ncbi:MAG: extracellular solute-binding protein [Lachnospiraceae bacterium]|nr:extracellular solute-binding protein [Lachnospiraceae bacterium]
MGAMSVSADEIRLFNNKVEINEGLNTLAAKYEEETGVKVTIESIGGGVDAQATLKGYYQGGNMPDIFVFEGDKDYPTWEGLMADLSDMAWVEDTEAEYTVDGAVYGFPTTTEAIGLAYNKAVLDAAGIDPASITGPESMRAAFETLNEKKDELGLTAVIGYGAEATALYWSTGQHLYASYIDSGLSRDDTTYIDMMQAEGGPTFDDERLLAWAEMVALFNEYSDPDLLVSGTYDQQVLNFAAGKYAFVTQGSWIGATITGDDAEAYNEAGNFEIGMLPYAFIEGQDTILTNSPNWWGVYKDSENLDAAKAFLEWCASNDGGQQILVEDCGLISPYASCTYVAVDPYAQTISDYTAAGKTSAWHWLSMKEGLGQNATAVIFQEFAKGSYADAAEFAEELKSAIVSYYAN